MPYIEDDKRSNLDQHISNLRKELVGLELDYDDNNMEDNISYIFLRMLTIVYGDRESATSSGTHDALGVLESVKLEYCRKVIVPFRDQQEFDNGLVDPTIQGIQLAEVTVVTPESLEPLNEILDDINRMLDEDPNETVIDKSHVTDYNYPGHLGDASDDEVTEGC